MRFITFTHKDGEYYEGYWRNNLKHGIGTYYWLDGMIDEGEFEKGKLNGYAKRAYPDGRIKEGVWKDDKFQYSKKNKDLKNVQPSKILITVLSSTS